MHVLLWIAALSLFGTAAALGVIAWRTAHGMRVREAARVELLKALAFPEASAAAASGPSISNWTPEFLSEEEAEPALDTFEPAPAIFGERNHVTTVPRWWISLFAVGAAIVVVVLLSTRLAVGPDAASTTAPAFAKATAGKPAPSATAAQDKPIELIALQSRFETTTAFDVNGVVRNPAEGRELPQLMAVVELLSADGRILTSQTTPLERSGLEAGQTSAFSIVFQRVTGTVASYRVGFRSAGGDTIPHVDRRVPQAAAKAPLS